MPDFDELLSQLTNWGRWGDDDQRGALNHITADHRIAAAGLVRRGQPFSLAMPVTAGRGPQSGAGGRVNPMHFMTATGCDPTTRVPLGGDAGYTDDFIGLSVQGGTQWDALCHIFYDQTMYNGFPATDVTSQGAASNGIEQVHDQFVTRGVLLDVAAVQGVECLAPGQPITIDDLLAAEDAHGVSIGAGDVVVVRTGMLGTTDGFTDWSRFRQPEPGLHYETAALFDERNVAAVAADNSMVEATGHLPGYYVPFHMLALVNLGIHLGEYWYLEDLAEDCAADGVYEFLLSAAALPITGATGSPVNPIALK